MNEKLKILDLFSGIGGFSLGLERTGGFETVAFCEIEEFPRKVLKKHWPEVPIYEDVTKLTAERLTADGITPNAITAGFPCQDISLAGKQAGIGPGTRSGLWSEVNRLIGEIRPGIVILENVTNLLAGPVGNPGAWFSRILGDLAEIGYDAEWHSLPASYIGAWHKRDRAWVLAYSNRQRGWKREPPQPILRQHHTEIKPTRVFEGWTGRSNLPEPRTCGSGNGISKRLDGLGNAVVPQIPEMIGYAILESRKNG